MLTLGWAVRLTTVGYLQRCAKREQRAPLLSRLIPTASSTPACAWAWGALARRRLVPAPRSSGPSHTVRGGGPVQTEQNRTNVVSTSSHRPRPITRPSGGALANDESDAAPNRSTSESDRARYPGPAAATCFTPALHQAGPPARLFLSYSAQDHPQTPQSRSQPGSWRYMGSCSTRGTAAGSCPCGCSQDSTSSAVSAPCHGIPIPNPIPAQPRSSLVSFSRSLAPVQGAIYGRSGWIDEGFFLARTPFPPLPGSLGTSSLRLALGIISRDDDTGNLRVRKQLAQTQTQTGGQLPLSIESIPGRVR